MVSFLNLTGLASNFICTSCGHRWVLIVFIPGSSRGVVLWVPFPHSYAFCVQPSLQDYQLVIIVSLEASCFMFKRQKKKMALLPSVMLLLSFDVICSLALYLLFHRKFPASGLRYRLLKSYKGQIYPLC